MSSTLKSMNMEMKEFLPNIALGNILPDVNEVCDDQETIPSSNKSFSEVKIDERKKEELFAWKEKEMKNQLQVI